MHQYNLSFISDQDLFSLVAQTVSRYRREITLKEFNKNIIDPIKLTFDSFVYNKSVQETIADECLRQIDKTNSNLIGYFHQQLFNYVGNGWSVPTAGWDIVNEEHHIYVELKNKHNTMNSSSADRTYMRMQHKLLEDDQATCYLVEVIAKQSMDVAWRHGAYHHNHIRRCSIDIFYEKAFVSSNAFYSLCQALPIVIKDVLRSDKSLQSGIRNCVMNTTQWISGQLYT